MTLPPTPARPQTPPVPSPMGPTIYPDFPPRLSPQPPSPSRLAAPSHELRRSGRRASPAGPPVPPNPSSADKGKRKDGGELPNKPPAKRKK
ncbi:hypothetical protein CVT26_013115 [Gymnopilus dilepis]|uniref:Uncharacterized protein n=1 Tax=Gymnopilus dilepis TaxID=231916 RepID=A0A409YF63_9AGAR|nr:hypothetical protein CVT26_013115 [Gymnopilus dilepis]